MTRDRIQDSKVSVLTYWNGKTAHTVAIEYDRGRGMFNVYNDNSVGGASRDENGRLTSHGAIASVDDWLKGYMRAETEKGNRSFQPWSLITLGGR